MQTHVIVYVSNPFLGFRTNRPSTEVLCRGEGVAAVVVVLEAKGKWFMVE
jgi:hypothetical protein